MRIDLHGRVALVTGSTRGIGRAIAESLAAAGASVAVTGRDQGRADAVAAEIAAAHGVTARGYACDVGEIAQCSALVEAVEKDFGSLDVLVNNAGLTRDNLIMRLKDEDWDTVIDANLRGAFATCRAASRGMMKRRAGRVINLASVVGIMGNKGQVNYAASKAGLIGLTKSLARELGSRGVCANVVAPGYIDTDMTAAMPAEAKAALSSSIPLERLGTPADIAAMVTFLASDQASYITGQVFVVDGGLAM
ncbi:MAG: 3-oxoacyl-[acyl-carrier-protein] reductase [Gemmatimonadaceae bacterium]|jgi:3-oxoacyl-[acyl-carrier protein] reductase|nr:3-oxoacyl-[acyl-carrier-protein] reductase [Gemmatimonadaceae bacterium]